MYEDACWTPAAAAVAWPSISRSEGSRSSASTPRRERSRRADGGRHGRAPALARGGGRVARAGRHHRHVRKQLRPRRQRKQSATHPSPPAWSRRRARSNRRRDVRSARLSGTGRPELPRAEPASRAPPGATACARSVSSLLDPLVRLPPGVCDRARRSPRRNRLATRADARRRARLRGGHSEDRAREGWTRFGSSGCFGK
jgi:hypothetical protein